MFKTESVCMHFTIFINLNMCVCMEEGVTSEDYIALYDDMTFLGMFFEHFVHPLVLLFL